jgi:hypothetical protein
MFEDRRKRSAYLFPNGVVKDRSEGAAFRSFVWSLSKEVSMIKNCDAIDDYWRYKIDTDQLLKRLQPV